MSNNNKPEEGEKKTKKLFSFSCQKVDSPISQDKNSDIEQNKCRNCKKKYNLFQCIKCLKYYCSKCIKQLYYYKKRRIKRNEFICEDCGKNEIFKEKSSLKNSFCFICGSYIGEKNKYTYLVTHEQKLNFENELINKCIFFEENLTDTKKEKNDFEIIRICIKCNLFYSELINRVLNKKKDNFKLKDTIFNYDDEILNKLLKKKSDSNIFDFLFDNNNDDKDDDSYCDNDNLQQIKKILLDDKKNKKKKLNNIIKEYNKNEKMKKYDINNLFDNNSSFQDKSNKNILNNLSEQNDLLNNINLFGDITKNFDFLNSGINKLKMPNININSKKVPDFLNLENSSNSFGNNNNCNNYSNLFNNLNSNNAPLMQNPQLNNENKLFNPNILPNLNQKSIFGDNIFNILGQEQNSNNQGNLNDNNEDNNQDENSYDPDNIYYFIFKMKNALNQITEYLTIFENNNNDYNNSILDDIEALTIIFSTIVTKMKSDCKNDKNNNDKDYRGKDIKDNNKDNKDESHNIDINNSENINENKKIDNNENNNDKKTDKNKEEDEDEEEEDIDTYLDFILTINDSFKNKLQSMKIYNDLKNLFFKVLFQNIERLIVKVCEVANEDQIKQTKHKKKEEPKKPPSSNNNYSNNNIFHFDKPTQFNMNNLNYNFPPQGNNNNLSNYNQSLPHYNFMPYNPSIPQTYQNNNINQQFPMPIIPNQNFKLNYPKNNPNNFNINPQYIFNKDQTGLGFDPDFLQNININQYIDKKIKL